MAILIENEKILNKWQEKIKRGFLWITILRLYDEKAPLSGTDLKNRINKIHNNWDPSPGSIYPILKELENDGLIVQDFDHVLFDKKNKLYVITELGSELLVKLRNDVFAFRMHPTEFLKKMGQNEDEFKERFGSMCNNLSTEEIESINIHFKKILTWFHDVLQEQNH